MTSNFRRRTRRLPESAGQAMLVFLLALGLFLLAAIAFAVDMSNLWFHRQTAQTAADAACVAGAMDLLVNAQGGSAGNFPSGSPPASFHCSSAPTSAACQYAALNGYDGAGVVAGQPSNDVLVSFPGSVSGVTPPPSALAPTAFIQVNIDDRAPTFFSGLVSGSRTTDVGAQAVCGLQQSHAPIPIIVLNPSCPHAFQLSGSTTVKIVGGPSRSVQVNSENSSCAAATTNSGGGCNASGPTIDLSQGGSNFSGSSFGVAGAPTTAPSGFTGASWGPATPINDPYAQLAAPTMPATAAPAPVSVGYGVDGCPDHSGCTEYQPGLYTSAIVVKGVTAIFVPGVYYITGVNLDNSGSSGTGCVPSPTGQTRYGLDVDSNGVVRPASNSAPTSDGSNGVMFYLSGTGAGSYGSVFFGSNAGKPGGRTIDSYATSGALCPGATNGLPSQFMPSTVDGNVLLGQCTSAGTYLGTGSSDTSGSIRGLIFFQNRANGDTNGQASMQGGGGLVLSGNMYFHNCNSSGTGTNCSPASTSASPSSGYNAFFQLQGSPGSSSYVLGNITTDELIMGGGGNIDMALNPNAVYNILKASLLQ